MLEAEALLKFDDFPCLLLKLDFHLAPTGFCPLGLTQSRLAISAGVSQSIIAKIEAGSVDPSYSIVQRLFSALERAGVENPARRVDELISRPVVSVAKTQLVRDAVDLMRRRGYSQ